MHTYTLFGMSAVASQFPGPVVSTASLLHITKWTVGQSWETAACIAVPSRHWTAHVAACCTPTGGIRSQ